MTRVGIAMFAALTTFAGTAGGSDDAERLHALFAERHAWEMHEFPEQAMSRGDYSNADRITDVSLSAVNRRHRDTREHLARLESIDRAALDEDDLVSYDLLDKRLRDDMGDHRFRLFLMPVGQRFGPHQTIPQMADRVRFASALDYDNYLRRLALAPRLVEDTISLMRQGIREGRTPPRVAMLGVPTQLDALLEPDGLESLGKPFDAMPASVGERPRAELPRRFRQEALPAIREALEDMARFLDEVYLPAARESIAATDLPDGDAYYAHQLRTMTTTDLTAREIHDLGLGEVARIRAEMLEVIRRSDYLDLYPGHATLDDDGLFRAFVEYLRESPRFYYDDPEALLRGYRNICKVIDGKLPQYFRVLPRLPYGVEPIPAFMAEHQTTAYYSFGSLENGQSGTFFANTSHLDQRPKYEMIALAMHEAVPGHHLQSALAQEMRDVPEFRRNTWITSFGEGWALYSERLGIEMGLYEDPYDDFGRLTYEMWRACRLVVDPGMHALGWTRDRAVEFMRANTALSERNIETEIDRYIAWPGQACAYKVGELRIRALRRDAESRLGADFDIRAFHDVVLGAGPVPLTVLERRVRAWIEAGGR